MAGRIKQIGRVLAGLLIMTAHPQGISASEASDWRVVNDSVMGGVSESQIDERGESIVFSGTLSLENNGGFTSARKSIDEDWSTVRAIRMKVKGDGRQYIATVRVQGRSTSRIYYRRAFDTVADEWLDLDLSVDSFEAYAYGRRMPTVPPLSRTIDRLTSVGLMLADKNPGAFSIEVRDIEPIRAEVKGESEAPPAKPVSVQAVFGAAISEGAPLYNQGRADRCADIYQSAIVTVLLLDPPDLTTEHRSLLTDAVREARGAPSEGARAWLLRNAMDRTQLPQ
jgi:NADH dehydrogenase [ubiquinone] 1 alpha subcomplex assembly factor 1